MVLRISIVVEEGHRSPDVVLDNPSTYQSPASPSTYTVTACVRLHDSDMWTLRYPCSIYEPNVAQLLGPSNDDQAARVAEACETSESTHMQKAHVERGFGPGGFQCKEGRAVMHSDAPSASDLCTIPAADRRPRGIFYCMIRAWHQGAHQTTCAIVVNVS